MSARTALAVCPLILTTCAGPYQPGRTEAALHQDAEDAAAGARAAGIDGGGQRAALLLGSGRLSTGGERNVAMLALGLDALGFEVTYEAPRRGAADRMLAAAGLSRLDLPARPAGPPSAATAADVEAALAGFGAAAAAMRARPGEAASAQAVAATRAALLAAARPRQHQCGLGDAGASPAGKLACRVLRLRLALDAAGAQTAVAERPEDAVALALATAGAAGPRGLWYVQNTDATADDAWLGQALVPVVVHASLVPLRFAAAPGHARVARNGINTTRFAPRRGARLGTGRPFVVVDVAYLDRDKNQVTLVAALAAAAPRLPPFELWLVGNAGGPARDEVLAAARAGHIAASVQLLGERQDVPELLRRADMFAFPSRHEGFGLALAEAMATGLPCLASDLPATRDIVGPGGEAGILLPADDVQAWAEALVALAGDPGRCQDLGARARARILAADMTVAAMLRDFAAALLA